MRLDDIDVRPDATGELTACCATPIWVAAFAAGRPAVELLDIIRTRLHNDPARERAVLRGELQKINLRRLLETSEPERGSDGVVVTPGRQAR